MFRKIIHIACFLGIAMPVTAQDFLWTGGGSGTAKTWFDAANWSPSGAGDTIPGYTAATDIVAVGTGWAEIPAVKPSDLPGGVLTMNRLYVGDYQSADYSAEQGQLDVYDGEINARAVDVGYNHQDTLRLYNSVLNVTEDVVIGSGEWAAPDGGFGSLGYLEQRDSAIGARTLIISHGKNYGEWNMFGDSRVNVTQLFVGANRAGEGLANIYSGAIHASGSIVIGEASNKGTMNVYGGNILTPLLVMGDYIVPDSHGTLNIYGGTFTVSEGVLMYPTSEFTLCGGTFQMNGLWGLMEGTVVNLLEGWFRANNDQGMIVDGTNVTVNTRSGVVDIFVQNWDGNAAVNFHAGADGFSTIKMETGTLIAPATMQFRGVVAMDDLRQTLFSATNEIQVDGGFSVDNQTAFDFTFGTTDDAGATKTYYADLDAAQFTEANTWTTDMGLDYLFANPGETGLLKAQRVEDWTEAKLIFNGTFDDELAGKLLDYLNGQCGPTIFTEGCRGDGTFSILMNSIEFDVTGYTYFAWDITGFNTTNNSSITLAGISMVPEPATWFLLLGGTGVLWLRRRK